MDKEKCPVSVIIMTKNEELNITKCLPSVECFDEVFVVDSGSTDRTCDISEDMGAKVVQFEWNGKYPKKKQWCLENLPFSHDWVLYVDADEQVYPELAEEINDLMKEGPDYGGYFVGYDYVFMGRVLKYGHKIYKMVLFDRNKGRFLDYDDLDATNMWEVEGHYHPKIDGSISVLKNKMLHNDHENLYRYFEKLNRYTEWEAVLRTRGMLRHNDQASLPLRRFLQYIGDRLPFKGLSKFVYCYILRLGFLDGGPGFSYAVTLGIYYSMISLKSREIKIDRS